MKKLFFIALMLMATALLYSQGSKRHDFSFVIPWDTDTIVELPGYSAGAYSYVLDFGGVDALDATYEFGVYLGKGDVDFSDITFPNRTFPVTVNLTNCPDTVCWGEREFMPFYDVRLKVTPGTVTPGTRCTGRIVYTR